MDIWQLNTVSYKIIGAAIDVHRKMGPGLNEKIYEECLIIEMRDRGLKVEQQVAVPVHYKEHILKSRYYIDLLVENDIIIELKAV